MMLRALRLALATALCTSALMVAEPAAAVHAPPTIGALDTSVPGHVKGTVIADQLYVWVYDGVEDAVIATLGGIAQFDLSTWGLRDAWVYARACPDATPSYEECSDDSVKPFTATDVQPEVTWPADTTIGKDQSVDITVSDPNGGGALQLTTGNFRTEVARNGTTSLDLTTDANYLYLNRCSADLATCTGFTPSVVSPQAYEVRHAAAPYITSAGTSTNRVISIAKPSALVGVDSGRDEPHPFTFDWHLTQGGVPVEGSGGSVGGTLSAAGAFPLEIDGSALADGHYFIAGTMTIHHPDFGDVVGDIPTWNSNDWKIVVDKTVPTFSAKSQTATKIYPYVNAYGYVGTVGFTVSNIVGSPTGNGIEIRTPGGDSGTAVARVSLSRSSSTATVWRATWNGRNTAGRIVPEGYYTGYIVDLAGNRGASVGTVYVSNKKLVAKTFTRRVQASGSTVDTYVGSCSRLKRPVRDWVGSQGYYANTKCGTQTAEASAVDTMHAIKVPAAVAYDTIRVSTYGGSARSTPNSRAIVSYRMPKGGWYTQGVVSSGTGYHAMPDVRATNYIWSDHYFVWGFGTAYSNRYDVRDFTVILRYKVLG